MKEYRFHQTKNPLPLAVTKDSFRIYLQEMEKLLPMEGIFEILEKWFPLARMKHLLKNNFAVDGKSFN